MRPSLVLTISSCPGCLLVEDTVSDSLSEAWHRFKQISAWLILQARTRAAAGRSWRPSHVAPWHPSAYHAPSPFTMLHMQPPILSSIQCRAIYGAQCKDLNRNIHCLSRLKRLIYFAKWLFSLPSHEVNWLIVCIVCPAPLPYCALPSPPCHTMLHHATGLTPCHTMLLYGTLSHHTTLGHHATLCYTTGHYVMLHCQADKGGKYAVDPVSALIKASISLHSTQLQCSVVQ
jgi:hypothetical protein